MASQAETTHHQSTTESPEITKSRPSSPSSPVSSPEDQDMEPKKSLMQRFGMEVIAFLGSTCIAVRIITQQQLLQDKICVQSFACDVAYCRDLNDQPDSRLKDDILSQYSFFLTVKELTILLPHILTVLYIGSWCDRYRNGRWYCMIAGAVSLALEILLMAVNAVFFELPFAFLILSFLPSSFFGSNLSLLIVLYSYVAAYVRPEDRTFRLVIITVVQYVAVAFGTMTGGLILKTEVLFFDQQFRNYAAVFVMAMICAILMFLIIVFFMRETNGDTVQDNERRPLLAKADMSDTIVEKDESVGLFSLRNLYDILHAVVRPRKGHERKVLVLLVLSGLPIGAGVYGKEAIVFPVVQKLYNWDNFEYSVAATFGYLIHPLLTLVFMPVMFSLLKAGDLQVALIGATSYFLGNLFLGAFGSWSPIAFYASLVLTSLSGLIGQGIRAHVSRIANADEVGKFFSLMAMLEAILPFVGSGILSAIISETIAFFPTLVFHVIAFWVLIGIAILSYVDLIPGEENTIGK